LVYDKGLPGYFFATAMTAGLPAWFRFSQIAASHYLCPVPYRVIGPAFQAFQN
jgi:hypothetical protein